MTIAFHSCHGCTGAQFFLAFLPGDTLQRPKSSVQICTSEDEVEESLSDVYIEIKYFSGLQT
jgi:hypothetical protein